MTLLEEIPSGRFREASIPVLETKRLAMRAARLEDAKATNNLPANKHSVSKLPEILAQFAKGMDIATHPSVWGVSEFPTVIEVLDKGMQSIIIGEKTPEQVAAEVQAVKERELAKRKAR